MNELISHFRPITLDEMSGIRLMNRTDTKFVTTKAKLMQLLEMANTGYRVQEVDGQRNIPYYTVYFDTPDSYMYMMHQHGHTGRQKVRIRSYVDSDLNFLEVKTKDNHGRTKKKRVEMADFDPKNPRTDIEFRNQDEQMTEYGRFLAKHLFLDPETLSERLENNFRRITLVNNEKTERLTIDTDLRFHNIRTDRRKSLDSIAIIELKRDGLQYSPILELLRELRIHPMGFSKYCMGQAMTDDSLQVNRFKLRLRKVDKLLSLGQTENF